MPTFRSFILMLACLSAVAETHDQNLAAADKAPNVLLIIDDQHSPRAMGYTDESPVITPYLDRLAAESVRFSAGYSNSPVCGPARHSLYTGVYPSSHGVLRNDVAMREIPTLMSLLNTAGYTTANIGKMHNAPYHHRRDFQYVLHHEFYESSAGISHYAGYLEKEMATRGPQPEKWWATRPGTRSWLEHVRSLAGPSPQPEELTNERWITDESLKFIRDQIANRPDQPFFLHASYFPPHHPYGPIEKYAAMYDPDEIDLPPNFDRRRLDGWCRGAGKPDHMSDDDVRWMLAHYYAFCTQLDAEVGRLLAGLNELGVADDTLVIFISDHGDMLSEHGMFYKGVMYEASVRTPFLIRWPGVAEARDVDTPVMHVDLVPTILAAAGQPIPDDLHGVDLAPLLRGNEPFADRAIYSEYYSSGVRRMVRRGPFKLIAQCRFGQWDRSEYVLFNVQDDPWEMTDLAADPAHGDALNSLKGDLAQIWAAQEPNVPEQLPPIMTRSTYNIPWPADPWKAVEPAGAVGRPKEAARR